MEYLADLAASWQEEWTAAQLVLAGGAMIGLLFGVFAERSDFCTRSAIAALLDGSWRRDSSPVIKVLLAMLSALVLLQLATLSGLEVVTESAAHEADLRLGGILIGALLFGAGMALCRSCISRLLVLTARGNTRSLISLVFMGVVSWATISGVLARPRMQLATLGSIEAPFNNSALISAGFLMLIAVLLVLSWRPLPRGGSWFSLLVWPVLIGALVPVSFIVTGVFGADPFDPVAVEGLRYIQPVADSLAYIAYADALPLKFGLGIVGGTLIGAAVSARLAGRSRIEGFDGAPHPLRYITGAALMGFGGVVCGGCTINWLVTNTAAGHLGMVIAAAGFFAGMWLINHAPLCARLA